MLPFYLWGPPSKPPHSLLRCPLRAQVSEWMRTKNPGGKERDPVPDAAGHGTTYAEGLGGLLGWPRGRPQEGNKSSYFLSRLGFRPLACVFSVQSHQLSTLVLGLFLVLWVFNRYSRWRFGKVAVETAKGQTRSPMYTTVCKMWTLFP